KCAAGTGRFLEMMARTMDMTLEEMSARGLNWKENVKISSMCTVFAESEVVSLIARNTAPEDIIHGLNESVASRTAALLRRVGAEDALMMTGGVAQNRGVVEVLEKKLGRKIHVSEYAQLCGAIGAALLAREA
ncbi:MAG: acyl-CoA dehydratase activase, partial [Eubacterium sp.]|nr:acyl-CoA dehydratase activase [Eubacterium sp.]